MGTRADFWIGTGSNAEWLGSVAWDGYEWAEDKDSALANATTESGFREAVSSLLASRDDATQPSDGWPWPWSTSSTTDYAYYFKDGKVQWDDHGDWPDMSARKKVTWGRRSGIIIIGG